jgi:hypothetical protein
VLAYYKLSQTSLVSLGRYKTAAIVVGFPALRHETGNQTLPEAMLQLLLHYVCIPLAMSCGQPFWPESQALFEPTTFLQTILVFSLFQN